ncbi:MAG: hypothetical protein AAGJ74_13475 [Pseudomonadota bacterium]
MSWAQRSKEFADAAERARQAGDDVAMIALLKAAAECNQIARFLSQE